MGTNRKLQATPWPTGQGSYSDKTLAMEQVIQQLSTQGYVWFKGGSYQDAKYLRTQIGNVINQCNVRHRPSSNAILSGTKTIPAHTDHHRADFIQWYMHKPADDGGGMTMLWPGDEIIENFRNSYGWSVVEKNPMICKEHDVFNDGTVNHRVIDTKNCWPSIFRPDDYKWKIYYSFWLADFTEQTDDKRDLMELKFKLFQQSVESVSPLVGTLEEGDIFIFDNRRMLHGRNGFTDTERHLERWWIETFI